VRSYTLHRRRVSRPLNTQLVINDTGGGDSSSGTYHNRWVEHVTSAGNRHVLPLFTSLLNVVFSYDPVGLGMPYNHVFFSDSRGPLINVALQVLIVCLDSTHHASVPAMSPATAGGADGLQLDVCMSWPMIRLMYTGRLC
jgi:hypothetical protein